MMNAIGNFKQYFWSNHFYDKSVLYDYTLVYFEMRPVLSIVILCYVKVIMPPYYDYELFLQYYL
ncbi:hypothetical protein QTP88_018342 [Uroleucon formosanum]